MNLIYNMEIPPLLLRIEGNNNPKNTKKGLLADLSCYDITVELKDGTIAKQASPAGSWSTEGVHIKGMDSELWITAGN